MKPFLHARISAHLHGGDWLHYQPVHDFFDTSKAALPDMRHRLMLHSDLGCLIAGDIFGETILNSDGKAVPVADIAGQHQVDDLGRTVPLDEWLSYCDVPPAFTIDHHIPEYDGFRHDPAAACGAMFGGHAEAYSPVVSWFLRSRSLSDHPLADAVTLNAFAIMLSERVFGPVLETAPGRFLPTRDIGEAMALGRFGKIPTLESLLSRMRTADWMYGGNVVASRRSIATKLTGLALTD